jgi:hypothetical protein
MPRLPKPAIAWRFRNNLSTTETTDLEHRARLLFEIKEAILGNGTGWTDGSGIASSPASGWTVLASSDSVAADTTDRWLAISDIVWETSGVAHSWILFEFRDYVTAGVDLQLLIDCSQINGTQRNAAIGVFISRAGFNVGAPSILNRPTAVDETQVLPQDGSTTTAPWRAVSCAASRGGRPPLQGHDLPQRQHGWPLRVLSRARLHNAGVVAPVPDHGG